MLSRCQIITVGSIAHVMFRCHNHSNFFEPREIKDYLLYLMAKYKRRYGMQIHDFQIMDNHAHFIVRVSSSEYCGHFMRTVNSQLARRINKYFNKDSQAIKERYKSPMISGARYLINTIKYIYMNRVKVNPHARPDLDYYCSASWHLNPKHRVILDPKNSEDERNNLLASLLDPIPELGKQSKRDLENLIKRLLSEAHQEIKLLTTKVFGHTHTISDEATLSYRSQMMTAYRRLRGPPIPSPITIGMRL